MHRLVTLSLLLVAIGCGGCDRPQTATASPTGSASSAAHPAETASTGEDAAASAESPALTVRYLRDDVTQFYEVVVREGRLTVREGGTDLDCWGAGETRCWSPDGIRTQSVALSHRELIELARALQGSAFMDLDKVHRCAPPVKTFALELSVSLAGAATQVRCGPTGPPMPDAFARAERTLFDLVRAKTSP